MDITRKTRNKYRFVPLNVLLIAVIALLIGYNLHLHAHFLSYFIKSTESYTWRMNVNYEYRSDRGDRDQILVLNTDAFGINRYKKRLVREQTLGYSNFNDLLQSSNTDDLSFYWYNLSNKTFYEVKLPLKKLRKTVNGAMRKAYLNAVFSYAMKPYYKEQLANYTALLNFELLPDGNFTLTMDYGGSDASLLKMKAKEVPWYTIGAHPAIKNVDDWRRLVRKEYNWKLEVSDSSVEGWNIKAYFYDPDTFFRFSSYYSYNLTKDKGEKPVPLCFQFHNKEKQITSEIKIGEEILTILDYLTPDPILFQPPIISAYEEIEEDVAIEEIEAIEEEEEEMEYSEERKEDAIVLHLHLAEDPQNTRLTATKGEMAREIPVKHLMISTQ